jgi:hypothetical protein
MMANSRLRPTGLFTLVLGGALALPLGLARAETVVLKHFTGGKTVNSVGLVQGGEDTELAGPQAIYAGEDGKLFLLDQVNGRILSFDPKNPQDAPRALQLPAQLQPTDLVVRKGDIFVWDGEVRALRTKGRDDEGGTRGLEEFQTRAAEDEFTVGAFAQMGSQKPADADDLLEESTRALPKARTPTVSKQSVLTRGGGPVIASIATDKVGSAAEIDVRGQGSSEAFAKLRLKVSERLGAVEFLEIDSKGRMFVLAENIPTNTAEGSAAFVARYSPMGALEGIFELPLSETAAVSRRAVTVSEDGDVFFLRTRQAAVDVLGVGFRPMRNAKVIDVRGAHPPGLSLSARGKNGPRAAVRPLTRTDVIRTAFMFERARWRLTPSLYGKDPDTVCTGFGGRVRRPGYLHGKLGQEVRGIPYCWGCHGSLQQISNAFAHGALAGNICTRNEPRRDAAGVDCSAFVSATWGLASHFTTIAIPTITKVVSNPWEMLPGDAFNKPGSHVMLFLRFTPDRKVEVMEASPGACNGKVCRNVYPLSALLARGYTPVRYRALVNDVTARVEVPSEEAAKPAAKKAPDTHRRRGSHRRRR